MSVKSITEENVNQVNVVDDLTESVDLNKLAALKSKMQKKQEVKMKKETSLKLGIVGTGHAGSKIASAMYQLGYPAIALNTAMQDLKFIDLPDAQKMFLEFGLGGSAKELDIGRQAAELHKDAIASFVDQHLSESQVNMLCLSLGGGSGAGSCEVLVDVLTSKGKPVVVMAVLPMETEDAQTKLNSLETLSKLTKFAQSKVISNLIVIDNSKLESIYRHVGQMDFFTVANKAIVNTIDVFNTLSCMASHSKALDSAEFAKMFIDGEGLSIYGDFQVENYQEDTAIAEAVINNLSGNLLAEGFDLKQSKYVGFIVTANKNVWSKIPASAVNYAGSMINDLCGNPAGVFKGMYIVDEPEDVVKVYSMFSGLGLPTSRIEQLKNETKDLQQKMKTKTDSRSNNLTLDMGTTSAVSDAQKIREQIAKKNSGFGKLLGNTVTDRRK